MADTVIRIGREQYRFVATVDEGQTLYFTAGDRIAVEKFDMRIGQTEFDFQVTSRRMRGAQPEQIAATQDGLDREFMEARVKSNLMGLPVSLGNLAAMARDRRISLTYGELRPQVFRSAVPTRPVAWRIWFKRTWYTGQASGRGLRASSTAAGKATASANGSARIGAASAGSSPGVASGGINPLTNDAGILRVYVAVDSPYRAVAPFDRHDMTFRQPTLGEHINSFVHGRGW